MTEPVTVSTVFDMSGTRYTVTAVSPKAIRYQAPGRDGFSGTQYTTTPAAFHSLESVGLIVRVPADRSDDV